MTEHRLDASSQLDELSIAQTLELINQQDQQVPQAVAEAMPEMTKFVQDALTGLQKGGRVIYLGAGPSGRLGVLDASEIPPTFHASDQLFQGLIAGGDSALRKSSEGKEDDPTGSYEQLHVLNLTQADAVLGIAAGGTTPYVWGGLKYAQNKGCTTGFLCCVDTADLGPHAFKVDHLISLKVGPEVVTGSTRMKAGTATKLALNMISTTLMIQQGKTWGNLMVDLKASNDKLVDRALRILTSQSGLTAEQAHQVLLEAEGQVKRALVMIHKQCNAAQADELLTQHQGKLSLLLGRPI